MQNYMPINVEGVLDPALVHLAISWCALHAAHLTASRQLASATDYRVGSRVPHGAYLRF